MVGIPYKVVWKCALMVCGEHSAVEAGTGRMQMSSAGSWGSLDQVRAPG